MITILSRALKPGPKGPGPERIQAICELKRRNPALVVRRAPHLAENFGLEINKDVVRRVLAAHYGPERREYGPSWLTYFGHAKDSLWSLDYSGLSPSYSRLTGSWS